ncbi:MarR family winged helix-turn-helix transcriptional regulator [Naasia sp. SYSU D00057]|uniref:MarR family winged helix-turn-helix transcriptional regulator n=1 Tax=Naasia sp. SYSU D00057 TaxID=2817380 RepID=UPI001B30A116|nr:MarR family transcriptional regulator [Naasia sp. SYSU D00057]
MAGDRAIEEARGEQIARVLEGVVLLSRTLTSHRRAPFAARRLTGTQIETLFLLAHRSGPLTPGRLARLLGITAGAVTQLLDGLREEGLVEVTANPEDARSRIVSLTRDAAAEVARFESEAVVSLLPRFAALTDGELTELADLLHRVEGLA